MSVETDTLADAAQRFSEAIRAERSATVETLESERKAAVQIIEALRRENERRSRIATNRFFVGFAIGAAIGVAVVIALNPRSGDENRTDVTEKLNTMRSDLSQRVRVAVEAGRRATLARERELWQDYRERMSRPPEPPASYKPDNYDPMYGS
jgi:hypothetical protein